MFKAPKSSAPGVKLGSTIDGGMPDGDPATAWDRRRDSYKLVAPANRQKFTIAVIGTGLAGGGVAAALGELGYDVHVFTYHDSPRRAHSGAAQGGINAARARKVDGDSLLRFVTDTLKGGDFRAREAEVFRLAEESVRVIDHFNALAAPFAREYGGVLASRSFGGVQVSRTYYTRGQTGQQLQIATHQALLRQVQHGTVKLHTRSEMQGLIVEDGQARGVVVRNLATGAVYAQPAHAVVICSGGYGTVYNLSTLAVGCNATASWRVHRAGAYMAGPSWVQFHPTALPVLNEYQSKTILMSESLRNDGRVWAPVGVRDDRPPSQIPEEQRDYFLERMYPAFGNLSPRDIASRACLEQIAGGHGVGPLHNAVYLDLTGAVSTQGRRAITEKYANLFEVYRNAIGEEPLEVPLRIAPSAHFTMGGLWADFDLMTSIPGLFVGGEAGFGYHGANRLGANSLLSAAVDGWFTLPLSVANYLAPHLGESCPALSDACVEDAVDQVIGRLDALQSVHGHRTPASFHKALGALMYQYCGMNRSADGLRDGIDKVRQLRAEFWDDVAVPGGDDHMNVALEKAGRVADFLELAELMCVDALDRDESCGAHFRVEHQADGEVMRDDARWQFVSAWQTAPGGGPLVFTRHAEPLEFSTVPVVRGDYT